MKQSTNPHCLSCHCELPLSASLHGGIYQVCDSCADIIQHSSHEDFSRVVKAVCGSLDSIRREDENSRSDAKGRERIDGNLHTEYRYGGRVHLI